MRLLPVLAAASVLAVPAFAGSEKALQRQLEARAEVQKLLSGGSASSALARLHYLGEERYAAGQLIRAWDEITDDEQRRKVAFVLAGLGEPSAESLFLEFIESSDSAIRMSGAQGLGRIHSRKVSSLAPLLADPSLGVRREAAKAMGEGRNRKLAKPLLKAAKLEGEPEVRAAMLVAVGRSGDPSSAKELVGFLKASSESTRLAAAQALCLLGHEKGFAFARKLLASEDKFVRRQGVALFEGIAAKKASPYLEPALRDKDRQVAAAAARILYEGGDASKLEWLVLASHLARGEDKLAIESELERLRLTDEQRAEILKQAGVE